MSRKDKEIKERRRLRQRDATRMGLTALRQKKRNSRLAYNKEQQRKPLQSLGDAISNAFRHKREAAWEVDCAERVERFKAFKALI